MWVGTYAVVPSDLREFPSDRRNLWLTRVSTKGLLADMDELRRAQQAVEQARVTLQQAVTDARAEGRTWADIGKELHMTRQAAFKRFGKPIDPENGEHIAPRSIEGLRERTDKVFTLISDGNYDDLGLMMNEQTAQELPAALIADTWRSVLTEIGALQCCSGTGLELPGGSPLNEDEQIIGTVIGSTVLACEAGQLRGRVAFDEQSQVVGLLMVKSLVVV